MHCKYNNVCLYRYRVILKKERNVLLFIHDNEVIFTFVIYSKMRKYFLFFLFIYIQPSCLYICSACLFICIDLICLYITFYIYINIHDLKDDL